MTVCYSRSVDKKRVIQHLTEYLTEELAEKPPAEKGEIESLLMMYRFLPSRAYGKDDVIVPSALVTLKTGESVAYYFIVPRGGGLVTQVEGKPLQVITPNSPLGEAMLGKKQGDRFSVEIRGAQREYEIVSVV